MIAEGSLKMVLLGIVGASGAGIGGFRNYVGSSWKVISSKERINMKLRDCTIYKAKGFNAKFTKSEATISEITHIGNAEAFLNNIKGENLFKKAVHKRCLQLSYEKDSKKNIYVWRGSSTEFKDGDDKWYYTPILQQTDWLQKALDQKSK